MKSYSIDEYQAAGCPQYSSIAITPVMQALHSFMGGKVCDTGCNFYNRGKCPAYRALTKPKSVIQPLQHVETVKSEAARRGVSIKQVRRERRDQANEV